MSLVLTSYGRPFPRRQAQLLVELLIRQDSALRSILAGRRRDGKSDLLGQIQAALFEKADGPMPFRYAFEPRRDPASLARHFMASFCQQMRAFGMRQQEMLGESLALLERELERPGLPLALTELGRDFLSLPPEDQLEFAAALPAQFAFREGRSLCLLLDDAENLHASPAFLSYHSDPRLSWLITGRLPQLQRMAAERAWSHVVLQPFTQPEALSLAEDRCRQFEVPFSQQAWENWFEMAGTSPWWVCQLIESAVLASQPLESTESLGRTYLRELSSGGIGRWMEGRWQKVFAKAASGEKTSADGKERIRIAEQLLQGNASGPVSAAVPPDIWESLVAEQWVENAPLGQVVRLEMIERDWLELAVSTVNSGLERARAEFLQAFLLRAEGVRQWRQMGSQLREIRENLLQLPQSGSPASAVRSGKELRLFTVCSIRTERTNTAELFWCYGFRPGSTEERRDRPEGACLYLIAFCRQEPTAAEVKQWSKRLQEEARALPVVGSAEKAASGNPGLEPRYELWLALPRGASLVAVAGEQRMRWEALERLLKETAGQRFEGALPPMPQHAQSENQARLIELEARAQWLEEELATARELFRKESSTLPHVGRTSESGPAQPEPVPDAADHASQLSLSVNLLLASADVLALYSQNHPAEMDLGLVDAVRVIQRRAQKLADALHARQRAALPTPLKGASAEGAETPQPSEHSPENSPEKS